MKDGLIKYLNQEIGINLVTPFRIDSVDLVGVTDEHFTVVDHNEKYTHHFSFSAIVQIIENPEGVKAGGLFKHKKLYPVVVKVGHLIEYAVA